MNGITRFGLDASRLTSVFIMLVIVAGLLQFMNFPRQEDPPIVIREVVVSAQFPGMKPEDVEQLITRQIEAELRAMPEIEDIWSDSKTGVAVVHADTADEYNDVDAIWQKVRNRMLDLAPKLPAGTIGPFVNDEFGLVAVATIALWTEGFTMGEMREAARDIRDRLYELDGIRKVELWGVHEEQVFLEFSTAKLAQLGVSIQDIIQTLRKQNVVLPGGRYTIAGQDVIIEPSGNFRSVEDIENVLIAVPGTEQSVRLKDLLRIRRGFAEPASDLAYYNGKRAIVISVSITPGVNAVEFGERLTAKVRDLEARLPIGYVLDFATFQPDLVQKAVDGALTNVYQTLVIVLIVVVAFLGLRTGLIVGSFVPMTMLMGLIIMRFAGIELERISIASAIIALGMLVDNGIVIAEDIRNRLESGEERRTACLNTAGTLAVPLLTSSLTTILAFVPVLLLTGQTGEYAYSLPMVVTILLLSSWFLSMYMTPFMCFWFMKVSPKADAGGQADDDPYSGKIYVMYRALLNSLLDKRYVVLLATFAVLAGGGYVGSKLVREMFGHSDRNQFLVYVDLPAGYSIEATEEVVQRLTGWLSDESVNPEITGTIAYVGTGGPRFVLVLAPFDPDPHRAFIIASTETGDQVVEVAERVRSYIAASLPEVEGRVKRMWTTGPEPGFLEIRLYGPDAWQLYAKGVELTDRVRAMPGTTDIRNNWENTVIKAPVMIDQARARRAGISSLEVANSLQAYIDGIKASEYREGDQAIPIVIQSMEEERAQGSDFFNIRVHGAGKGTDVPLVQIADIKGEWDFSRIARRNQERALTVEFKHEVLKAPELLEAIRPEIEALGLAEDYRWEVGGEIEQQAETLPKLFKYLPHCVFLIIVLLIWQFNSFRRPAIILFTLPLAFVGALVGLFLFRAPFDFFGILGLLSLAGIIINNGIVLIDKIDIERNTGRDPYTAVVEATVSRFRPICMTTITTILGVMPLIISRDPVFYSLALIIASGLAFGTVLTLGVVPVLYGVLFNVKKPATA
ncbi:MAG: efflux RND transporter permease subunit [Gammaproteobacteria bacterium]|nr:MAG: efflux RND transporter permease subunit [Gammaproteobacteria bacterium]